jgi:hypothetical protein
MRLRSAALLFALSTAPVAPAHAFCGFFVSGADAKLSNNASQVVLMRKDNRTVMTMSNTYQGPPAGLRHGGARAHGRLAGRTHVKHAAARTCSNHIDQLSGAAPGGVLGAGPLLHTPPPVYPSAGGA